MAADAKACPSTDAPLLQEVVQHMERIAQAVLGREVLKRDLLFEALSPILVGTWEEERITRFCSTCWQAAYKAAQKARTGDDAAVNVEAVPRQAALKAQEVLAEHHARELLKEEPDQPKPRKLEERASACSRAPEGSTGATGSTKTPEPDVRSEASSESSTDLKVRDRSNPFSVFQEVKESADDEVPEPSLPKRDRCKWTVKSYKNGLETTWDVLETDGRLRSMRIVGKEAVQAREAEVLRAAERPKGDSDSKEDREKSARSGGLSTLSYSETAEEECSFSMMRTVSEGTVQRLVEELEEDRRLKEVSLAGLEEGLDDAEEAASEPGHFSEWQEPPGLSPGLRPLPGLPAPAPPVRESLWRPQRVQSPHGSIGRAPSAPSRLVREPQSCPPSPLFLHSGFPEAQPPRRRVASHDHFGFVRQMSLESSYSTERSLATTPAALFPSTPECQPSPAGFMLPPLHAPPTGFDDPRPVVYVPVFVPHRCRNCGHECQPDLEESIPRNAWLRAGSESELPGL